MRAIQEARYVGEETSSHRRVRGNQEKRFEVGVCEFRVDGRHLVGEADRGAKERGIYMPMVFACRLLSMCCKTQATAE